MLFLLLIATASVAFATDAEVKPAEEVKPEIKEELNPEESRHSHDRGYTFSDGLELMRHRDERFNAERHRMINDDEYRGPEDSRRRGLDEPGPVILRTPDPLPHDGHPDIEAQNKIIADVFSPDYYQPTWVLDYRYLKTGGRDYTRGPGGQILILPKGVRSNEHKEFPDYDAYLEHLRLTRLSEQQDRRREHDGHRDRYDHGHGQTMWNKFG